jgi:squalene-hopene/tetraprenyl-beta-curcumene cyclase
MKFAFPHTRLFCFIPTGMILLVSALCGAAAESPPKTDADKKTENATAPSSDTTQAAIHRALEFLVKDAVDWRKQRGCATCHHGAMTVWTLSEAQRQGYPVDAATFAELKHWAWQQFVPRLSDPRDPRPGWNMVSTAGIYLGNASQELPVLSRDEMRTLSRHLAAHLENDGAWAKPPPKNGAPPTWESRETLTLLGWLAWSPDAAGSPDTVEAWKKTGAWLDATPCSGTAQALSLRLVKDVRSGVPKEQVEDRMHQLLGLQKPDGGWSQTKDLPSDAYATGQALWALSEAHCDAERPEIARGIAFLVSTQRAYGAWAMVGHDHEGVPPRKHNPVPITYFGTSWATIALVHLVPPVFDLATRQERARQYLRAFAATLKTDDTRPGKPVVRADVEFEVNDREFAELIPHLTAFPQLEALTFDSSRLSEAALPRLKQLSQIRILGLENVPVTDAGLEPLKNLTHLEVLNLKGTKVTDAGAADFQKAVPGVKISR